MSNLSLNEVFTVDTNSSQAFKKCYRHPVIVALDKDANDNPVVMKTLVDSCYTGKGLVTLKTARTFGLHIRPATHRGTFTSVGGKFKAIRYATLSSVMLPVQ